jgi:YidC/Oxa1 family membrane protein insertase
MSVLQQLLAPIGAIFHWVFYEPVYNILMVLYLGLHKVLPIGAFAVAIVVLTLLLRAALIPLTRKQLKSSRAMQELQPKLKELQQRYRNDPQGLMQAQQALYKEHGVNPASGCLPLLVQMPFLYALYYSFFNVLKPNAGESPAHHLTRINTDLYPFVPHLQQLPDTHFFWTSLATPDPIHILPILAAVLTFLQLRMAMPVRKPTPAGARPDSMTQATSTMQYVMPFFTLFIGWTFPAGLALYWTVSTLFSAVQQYFISGLGSLFVGVPKEWLHKLHLPEPQEAPTPATPPRSTAPAAGAARALTPAAPEQPQAGGLRGMLKQIREQMSAAQQLAAQQAAQREEKREPETPAAPVPPEGARAAERAQETRQRDRRPRREGPMLVKPPAAPSRPELPEEAIAREAGGEPPQVPEPLPEERIAAEAKDQDMGAPDTGAKANGARVNGAKANGSAAGSAARVNGKAAPGGSGGRTGGGAKKPAQGAHKSSGAGKGSSQSSARPRGSRPKGGK